MATDQKIKFKAERSTNHGKSMFKYIKKKTVKII